MQVEPFALTHKIGVGWAHPNSDWSWWGLGECGCSMFNAVYYLYKLLQLFIYGNCVQIDNIWTTSFIVLMFSITLQGNR